MGWRFTVEALGAALFEPITLDAADLDDAGVIDMDDRLLVSVLVKSHRIVTRGPARMRMVLSLVFETLDINDSRRFVADVEIEGKPDEQATLKRLRSAILEAYEKAREALLPAGPFAALG